MIQSKVHKCLFCGKEYHNGDDLIDLHCCIMHGEAFFDRNEWGNLDVD